MPLQKDALNIPFAQGLDLKTDSRQISPGKFLELENSIFTKQGLLKKRNGYQQLASLPDKTSKFVTTFNGNLTAIGQDLKAYSKPSQMWVDKGNIQPLELEVLPLIRSNTNQIQADTAISSSGLVCTVFSDSSGSAVTYKYAVADSVTGQNIVAPTLIPVSSGTVTGSPKVFVLGKYFVIVFTNLISATPHLQYIALNISAPQAVFAQANITSQYINKSTVSWDAVVANNSLYIFWNASDGGGAIRGAYLSSILVLSSDVTYAGHLATHMSVTADNTTGSPIIYCSFYDSISQNGFVLAVNFILAPVLAPTAFVTGTAIVNITSIAASGSVNLYCEVTGAYSYDSGIPTNRIFKQNMLQDGTSTSQTTFVRGVGLASKAFVVNSVNYMLVIYDSGFQPTYFLIDDNGNVIAKLAYSNASTYYTLGLPSVSVTGNVAQISYLIKDLIQSVNKTQGLPNPAGIYSQTGINLSKFTIGTTDIITSEIGGELNLTGGFLWGYDGYVATEQGFHLWPDDVEVTTATSGGHLADQDYFYQVTYEWSDNQGNIFRSAPSIPVKQTTSGGGNSANTINVPTLRLTYKTANPVKIIIYRWSTAQQTYYQVTSLTTPLLNDVTVDQVSFVDTLADSSIIGNSIIYTTGGVIENIAAPACTTMTLFKSRLFLIASETGDLWYSKQLIEGVPVEMSDLFTIFPAPTIGAGGSTGISKCIFPLDDKLIIFKQDAIYYITGNGPDNTGSNNDFSDPIFITSTVGSINQHSIIFMPQGLMFQSDKGIWLLGRDLNTTYIGSPVEDFNTLTVLSAETVPATNQVRFTLSDGTTTGTLMYDYFYGQWGEFVNIPAISSTLYEGLHTYIDSSGQVFQENPGSYLDGSKPTLMGFKTGWLNLAGVQGFERAYYFYILGQFLSPHKLIIGISYDYNPTIVQQITISPDNFSGFYGDDPIYGDSETYGGPSDVELFRVFLERQKCQAFQITLQEEYDPQYGGTPGAGLTISGINLVFGLKKKYVPIQSAKSVG